MVKKRALALSLALLSAAIIQTGTQAQTASEPVDVQPSQAVTATTVKDANGVEWQVKKKKEPWRKRHPKLHAGACKTRNVCLFLSPILDVTGKVLVGIGIVFF